MISQSGSRNEASRSAAAHDHPARYAVLYRGFKLQVQGARRQVKVVTDDSSVEQFNERRAMSKLNNDKPTGESNNTKKTRTASTGICRKASNSVHASTTLKRGAYIKKRAATPRLRCSPLFCGRKLFSLLLSCTLSSQSESEH